jgi:hypothetical protein
LQVIARALDGAIVPGYGLNSYALLATLDPKLFYWKTLQRLLFPPMGNQHRDLSLLLRLPKSGMTVSGNLYKLPMLAHRSNARDGSAWATTRANKAMTVILSPENAWQGNRFPNLETQMGKLLYPTPRANGLIGGSGSREMLHFAAMQLEDDSELLAMAGLQSWGTPTATDYKGGRKPETLHHVNRTETNGLRDQVMARENNYALNPDWVELLMGYPVGWTDITVSIHHDPTNPNSVTSQAGSQGAKKIA